MMMTLQDLLAPVTPERFFAEHYDRAPLHIRGQPGQVRRRAGLGGRSTGCST